MGDPSHTWLRATFLGAEPTAAVLTGGFWQLHKQQVRLTVYSDQGALIEPTKELWPAPQTGTMAWRATVPAPTGSARRTYVFEKHRQ